MNFDKSEALQKIRDQWIARIAHDLRGPLFAARGYARLLLHEHAALPAAARRYATSILENMDRLAALIGSLDGFPSDATLHLEPVDAAAILKRELDQLSTRATLHVASLPPKPVWTIADGAQLSTAVHKLLTALVDFSRSGACIEVRASQEHDEFVLRSFTRVESPDSPVEPREVPDIDSASRILRLHGGTAAAGFASAGMMHVTLRLPIIAPVR